MLCKQNVLLLLWQYIRETTETLVHVPENRKKVGAKIARLEARAHSVEDFIVAGRQNASRLNMYR
jgi:hypothetical protein